MRRHWNGPRLPLHQARAAAGHARQGQGRARAGRGGVGGVGGERGARRLVGPCGQRRLAAAGESRNICG